MDSTLSSAWDFLYKKPKMFISSNWTLELLLDVLDTAISKQYDVSIWVSGADILESDVRELTALVLYIVDFPLLKTDEQQDIINALDKNLELDFPDLKLDIIPTYPTEKAVQLLSIYEDNVIVEKKCDVLKNEGFDDDVSSKLKKILVPYDYLAVKHPLIFYTAEEDVNSKYNNFIRLDEENFRLIANRLPYYIAP